MTTATTTAPLPGVYPAVSMAEYHGWPAASNSRLSQLRRSPAHCKAAVEEGFEETDALRFGSLVHTAILEPETMLKRYLPLGQCSAPTKKKGNPQCTKGGVEATVQGMFLCGTHAPAYDDDRDPRVTCSSDDWVRACSMSAAVHDIPAAHRLLQGLTQVEASIVTDIDGLAVKVRLDGHSNALAGGCAVDLKTTVDASRAEFERSIFRYGYHRQGALYLDVARRQGLEIEHYMILAVEKKPPFASALYRLDEMALAKGAEELSLLLPQYATCLESDSWPGYNGGQVVDIGLPSWAFGKE